MNLNNKNESSALIWKEIERDTADNHHRHYHQVMKFNRSLNSAPYADDCMRILLCIPKLGRKKRKPLNILLISNNNIPCIFFRANTKQFQYSHTVQRNYLHWCTTAIFTNTISILMQLNLVPKQFHLVVSFKFVSHPLIPLVFAVMSLIEKIQNIEKLLLNTECGKG